MAFLDVRYRINTSATPEYTVPNNSGAITLAANDVAIGICLFDSQNSVFEDADYPTGFLELAETILDGAGRAASLARLEASDGRGYGHVHVQRCGARFGALFLSGCLSLRGRSTTNPPVVTVSTSTASNASPVSCVATGHTCAAGDDDLIIVIPDVTASGVADIFTPPAGYTSLTASESGFLSIYLALRENHPGGATGDLTSTLTLTSGAAGYICYHVRIPAEAAAPDPLGPIMSRKIFILP
jgi:hypothetical protein